MTETAVAPVDKLIRVYIKMRDKCKELEAQKEEIEEQMTLIKGKLLEACNAVGANSLNTPFGRLTRTLKTKYWTSDWESMHKFVIEHNAVSLLERRISQGVMKKFLLDNPDLIPPGLNSDSEYEVTVYRK